MPQDFEDAWEENIEYGNKSLLGKKEENNLLFI